MKKLFKIFSIIIGVLISLVGALVIIVITSDNGKILLPVEHKEEYDLNAVDNIPLKLHVDGNQIIDEDGNPVLLKGLMPQDPARLHNRNRFKKEVLVEIKELGSNVVRIPVHPPNWYDDEDYLWRYLDKIVTWAQELDMYVIIDWHYIGNIDTGQVQNQYIEDVEPKELTKEFWLDTANYFKDSPHVIYEIFNEPAYIRSREWAKYANEIVNLIREIDKDQLIIVGGVEYSKDLSWVLDNPIEGENIVYASHIYPAHSKYSWDRWFGSVASKYPVLITEWGFMDENRDTTNQHFLVGTKENYGDPLINYLSEHNIGWVACWYDDTWEPPMFTDDFDNYTNYGKFVLEELK